MKQSLAMFAGGEGPLDVDVDVNEADKVITMKFKGKEEYEKIYEFLNNMFFGDFLKQMMEAMMGAFGNMFGGPPDE